MKTFYKPGWYSWRGDNLHYLRLNETNQIIEEFWPSSRGIVNWENYAEMTWDDPPDVDDSWALKEATEEEIHEIKRKYIYSLLKNEI